MTTIHPYAEGIDDELGEPSVGAQSARVHVVEDDVDLAELLRFELETGGYAVEITSSVRDARRRIRDEGAFDLVISDVRLPGESGVKLLFSDAAVHRPPMLMMSAFVSRELRELVEWTGSTVLEKPFSFGHLHASVTRILMQGARDKADKQTMGGAR